MEENEDIDVDENNFTQQPIQRQMKSNNLMKSLKREDSEKNEELWLFFSFFVVIIYEYIYRIIYFKFIYYIK